MPELPEVETIRRDLQKHIVGKPITDVVLSATKVVRGNPKTFRKILVGQKITGISRIGKLLMFSISGTDNTLLIHLKMTGQLIFRSKDKLVAGGHSLSNQSFADLPSKHTRAEIIFADGDRLFFNDMRMFGYLELVSPKQLVKIKSRYGIEPGTSSFTKEAFQKLFKKRTAPVKAILLNQQLIAGVGNIYADEACFLAGIHPARRAHELVQKELSKLHLAVDKVIKKGIEKRGTTFSDFVDANGNSGGFLPFLRVYGRDGELCKICRTIVQKIKCAGRGTHFCPTCQKH